ncbi:MAG TPA: hypothetical protein VLH16_03475 [Bacteroidales bacterium]|nr:hypothetical protein [Bacteroidales bacterium]
MKHVILFFVALLSYQLTAQVKFEREIRVRAEEVPAKAVEWIDSTFTGTKRGFKWFYEISADQHSYEAKFRWRDSRFSVKFDKSGVLDDVEVEIDWYDIPDIVRQNIINYLETNFLAHKILRIQRQLIGSPYDLYQFIRHNQGNHTTINYELKIRARRTHQNELWEALFNAEGELLSIQLVVLTPSTIFDF